MTRSIARGGEDIEFDQLGPTAGIAKWNRVQMEMIAAGLRVPHSLTAAIWARTTSPPAPSA